MRTQKSARPTDPRTKPDSGMKDSAADTIKRLANALKTSALENDWQALAHHDAEIAEFMRQLQPVPPALTAAVEHLRQTHLAAQAVVRKEASQLKQKLQQFSEQQEGLRAYQQMENL